MNETQARMYLDKLNTLEKLINKDGAWFKYFTTHFNYIEQKAIVANGIPAQRGWIKRMIAKNWEDWDDECKYIEHYHSY